jgi:glucose-1-phosphate thymidylyltransferase
MRVVKAVLVASETDDDERWPGVGFGARSLMPIANKPVLVHALEALAAGGIQAVAILVGSSRDDIRNAVRDGCPSSIHVEYLPADAGASIVDRLRSAEGFLAGESFLVHPCDALLRDGIGPLGDRFARGDLDALVLRPKTGGQANVSSERDVPTPLDTFVGCFLQPQALAAAPEPGVGLAGLLMRLRERGGQLRVEQVDACLPCRGGREALLDANRRALEHLPAEPVRADIEQSELQGLVVVDPSARVHHSLVRGPAIVGARAEIMHAYIGPYTSVGCDVVVEGAEVEHSIVLDGAQVRFLGARLEASIVGRGARIERDYGLPRAVRLVIADRAEVTLA